MRKQMDEEQRAYLRVIAAFMRTAPCRDAVVLCPVIAAWEDKRNK